MLQSRLLLISIGSRDPYGVCYALFEGRDLIPDLPEDE